MRNLPTIAVLPLLVSLLGCQGQVIGPDRAGPGEDPNGIGAECERDSDCSRGAACVGSICEVMDTETFCEDAALDVGRRPIRRLSRAQYTFSVRDAFASAAPADSVFLPLTDVPDGKAGAFVSTTALLSDVQLSSYLGAAENVAKAVGAVAISEEAGCELASPECAQRILQVIGGRLFRRAVTAEETDRYLALVQAETVTSDRETAVEAMVTALLLSPGFLYREEATFEGDGSRALTDAALATRLSFLFWNSAPDDQLRELAANAGLREQLEPEIQRLLADPRAARGVRAFHEQWAGISELPLHTSGDSEWSPALGALMLEETGRFAEHVVLEGDGTLATLLTADFSFVSAEVAAIYGIAETGRVALPSERSGILTHPSILTQLGEDPAEIRRGKFIRDQLLCEATPPLPEGVVLDEAIDRLVTDPCSTCHIPMDLAGFGLRDFDALGRYRVDSSPGARSAELIVAADSPVADVAGTFEGPVELGQRLAASPGVQACVARQWFRFASGRVESGADRCSVHWLETAFNESDGNIVELMVAIASSEWFQLRGADDFSATEMEGL